MPFIYTNMNIHKLHKELYYHPPWIKDKPTFIKLLVQKSFSNQDIVTLARLYVKYSHLHCFQIGELNNYFRYMLVKMNLNTPSKLFETTHKIYTENH